MHLAVQRADTAEQVRSGSRCKRRGPGRVQQLVREIRASRFFRAGSVAAEHESLALVDRHVLATPRALIRLIRRAQSRRGHRG